MNYNPKFLILDADDRPLGAVEEEGGRWIGRDTIGRTFTETRADAGYRTRAER